jgi:hypothetical protein
MKKTLLIFGLVLMSAIAASAQQTFVSAMTGAQEVPPTGSSAKGTCKIVLNAAQTQITVTCTFSGLTTPANAGHIHTGAVGVAGPVTIGFTGVPAATSGTIGPLTLAITPTQVATMRSHGFYTNIHNTTFPGGEIRGQVKQTMYTAFDYDGDGRTDITTFRQSTNTFWIQNSLDGTFSQVTHGTGTGDNWLNNSADFDGDGRADPMLIKIQGVNAVWRILRTSDNTVSTTFWGDFSTANGEQLAMADYDGDGQTDIAVYRRLQGMFYILQSSLGNAPRYVRWGASTGSATTGDQVCVGDYDGDGKADPTTVRNEGGQRVFYTLRSSDGASTRTPWGTDTTDGFFFFAQVDFDGDGKQDIQVNRNIGGVRNFLVLRSSDGGFDQIPFGTATAPADVASFGDYDGDGRTDIASRRIEGANFTWYIRRSSDLATQRVVWGLSSDQ